MLIDTHSHIYSEEFNGETDDAVDRALKVGVSKMLFPNVDSSSVKRMLDLVDKYPTVCYPMMGVHPTSVKDDYKEELAVFDYWIDKRQFCGIGEIGMDLYWEKQWIEEQAEVFRYQLKAAKKYNLPVSIHVRDAFDETVEILKDENIDGLKGVFHAFSGTYKQARTVIDMGFKIGVGGVITYRNSGLDNLVAQLSPRDIVLETDAPWLSPVPFRGKRNETSYIIYVLRKVAEVFNCEEEEIAAITTNNVKEVFGV